MHVHRTGPWYLSTSYRSRLIFGYWGWFCRHGYSMGDGKERHRSLKLPDNSYKLRSGITEISKFQYALGQKAWPVFMQHDAVVGKYWEHLYNDFIEYQIGLFEKDQAVAVANTIPLHWNGKDEELPDTGLDWAIEKATDDQSKGLPADMLVAVQILIDPAYRGMEISYLMLDAMKHLALASGIQKLALPVRPTKKHKFPRMDMKEYLMKKTESGESYDPWIRVHLKSGGAIKMICSRSMNIIGRVSDWENWTGMKFNSSGSYIVEGALTPVTIDLESDTGIYLEPNVWITYALGK